jgi:hypothetical protein
LALILSVGLHLAGSGTVVMAPPDESPAKASVSAPIRVRVVEGRPDRWAYVPKKTTKPNDVESLSKKSSHPPRSIAPQEPLDSRAGTPKGAAAASLSPAVGAVTLAPHGGAPCQDATSYAVAVPRRLWQELRTYGLLPRSYDVRVRWSKDGELTLVDFVPVGAAAIGVVDLAFRRALLECLAHNLSKDSGEPPLEQSLRVSFRERVVAFQERPHSATAARGP